MFHRTMTRISFFVAGGTVCYAFANPDEGNVYDIFPSQKSNFAFIQSYKIHENEKYIFEKKWKNLAKYYQGQEGYLFNKLIRQVHVHGDSASTADKEEPKSIPGETGLKPGQ